MKRFFIIILLFYSFSVYSQESNVKFSSLSITDGLSQSYVYTILQDTEGFMWFGTTEGVNKFDGNEFTHYKFELADSNSLSDNFVVSLIETSDKEIWVATRDGGVNIFNKETEKFKILKNNTNNESFKRATNLIFKDSKKNIWIGTDKGLDKYSFKTETYDPEIYNLLKVNKLLNSSITSFFEDKHNNIWFGTLKGEIFKILNQSENIIKIFPISYNSNDSELNKICSILQDKENANQLWIVAEKGLFKLDISTNKIDKYNLRISESTIVTRGIIDDEKNIWIGSRNSGLFKFNTINNSILRFEHKPYDDNSISNNHILNFYIDNTGLLWIGTRGGGVNKLRYDNFYHIYNNPQNKDNIINNNIWAIYEDSLSNLWIGTENGLDIFDRNRKTITHIQHDPKSKNSLSNNFVFAICEDQFKNLWIGTIDGLNLFNRKTGEFKHFKNDPNNPGSISDNRVKAIYSDSKGNLWIGTRGGGLDRFNYEDESFTHYKHNPDDKTSIGNNQINTICESSDGTLWIGTAGAGLDRYNQHNNSFTHYNYDPENPNSLNDIYVLSLIEGPDKNLWIGTFNGGLNRFDFQKGEFTHFTTENGLANNIIYSIEIDDENNFWLSSNGALIKFSLHDKSVINFTLNNGLENPEFNINASFKNKTGQLFFGGINGVNYFDPKDFEPDRTQTSLHFTKLLLHNEKVQHGSDKPITKPLTFESQIQLKYNEYPFAIYYAALNFKHSKNNLYKYRIKKLSDEWIELENENKINFTKLPPGKYTLEIQSSNAFNLWKTDASIDIIITPPFWKKPWFVSFEILSLFILIFLIMKLREKKIKRNNKILEQKVKDRTREIETQKEELKTQMEFNLNQKEKIKVQNSELELHKNNLEEQIDKRTVDLINAKNKAEESDRLKSSFLANISHEIRTPMNAIVGFSELLRQTGNPSKEQIEMLNLIQFNSNSLLNIINDIVDIAKLEIGEVSLKNIDTDINKLLFDLLKTYNESEDVLGKDIELKLVHFNEPIILHTDANRIKQVFSKLLDNAIKYTEKGYIEFGYSIDKEIQSIRFYVKDTGIGLSEKQKNEIFGLFKKIETNKKRMYGGVGLGLSFCQKIVEQLKGEIWVESKENVGSTFYFTHPIITSAHKDQNDDKSMPQYNWENKSILVAEDEINNFKFLEAIIKPTKAIIFHAKNGIEAVDITQKNNIDLIIMDIKMPDMDGLEATEIIRKENKVVKIIAFTAYAMSNDEMLAINYGCDDYISKPAKPQFLMQKLSELLN
ncbi:two-component regulator propeller domain-containing protein [Bacteroidota bacterium]